MSQVVLNQIANRPDIPGADPSQVGVFLGFAILMAIGVGIFAFREHIQDYLESDEDDE